MGRSWTLRGFIRRAVISGVAVVMLTASLAATGAAQPPPDADSAIVTLRSVPLTAAGVDGAQLPPPDPAAAQAQRRSLAPAERPRLAPRDLSPQERDALERPDPNRYTYDVDSADYDLDAPRLLADVDPLTARECSDAYLGGYTGDFFFKNRFAGCHAEFLVYDRYDCSQAGCLPVARAVMKWAFVINMVTSARQVQTSHTLFDFEFPAGTISPQSPIGLVTGCLRVDSAGTASCQPFEGFEERTLAEWQAVNTATQVFNLLGEDPLGDTSDPVRAQIAVERRTFYDLAAYAYTYGGPGAFERYSQVLLNQLPLRCDVARAANPQYSRTSDCVFNQVTGNFRLDVQDPAIAESAQFIDDAHNNITATYPGINGTYVPGNQDGANDQPLTRMFYDTEDRTANNTAAVAACRAGFGPDYRTDREDGLLNDCDEYPFAATYEGVASVPPDTGEARRYAVRPLLNEHNQEVGRRLGQFLANDHLLDQDAFYVEPYNAP